MEQRALIARVQAGDCSAFADLTSRYRDMAFGYALALLRDFHLAQDVTQEAFLTAYLNLGRLQDPEAFPCWLQGIVRNHCHRVLRTRHLDLVPLDEGIGVPAMAKGPEQHLEEREALHRVLAQIMALPQAQREVATLFYVKDYAPREIAAFLDLPACGQVTVVAADGRAGYPAAAPYDRLVAWATADKVPVPWVEQLREGGRLVAPVRLVPLAGLGAAVILARVDPPATLVGERVIPGAFAPLTAVPLQQWTGPAGEADVVVEVAGSGSRTVRSDPVSTRSSTVSRLFPSEGNWKSVPTNGRCLDAIEER